MTCIVLLPTVSFPILFSVFSFRDYLNIKNGIIRKFVLTAPIYRNLPFKNKTGGRGCSRPPNGPSHLMPSTFPQYRQRLLRAVHAEHVRQVSGQNSMDDLRHKRRQPQHPHQKSKIEKSVSRIVSRQEGTASSSGKRSARPVHNDRIDNSTRNAHSHLTDNPVKRRE